MNREDVFRIVDALYRIHENEFHTQHILRQSIAAQYARGKLLTNSAMGATVAGAITVLPILVGLGEISWNSAPAWVIYTIVVGLLALWAYQIVSARDTFRELGVAETSATPSPVISWPVYIYERISTCGTRIRILDELAAELNASLMTAGEPVKKSITEKLDRNLIARSFCLDEIRKVQEEAAKLKSSGQMPEAEYQRVLKWAEPFEAEGSGASG